MVDVLVGETYISKYNLGRYKLLEVSDKYKTVMLEDELGKTTTLTLPSFKQRFILPEQKAASEPPILLVTSGAETSQATDYDAICGKVMDAGLYVVPRNPTRPKFIKVKYDGRLVGDIYVGNKRCTVHLKSESFPKGIDYHIIQNNYLDGSIQLDIGDYSTLNKLLTGVREYYSKRRR